MNSIKHLLMSTLIVFTGLFYSCDETEEQEVQFALGSGFFIVNEGAFQGENASLSYFDYSNNTLTNDVFYSVNNRDLGDQAQSMSRHNGYGYIIVQNSAKIEVIDLTDGISTATIDSNDGIVSPRYFVGVSDTKGYVSDWGADGVSGTVKVIDLATNSITKTIDNVGQGSNRMIIVGTNLLVANAGGWGSDNTVTVIDTTTDEIVSSITVGDNPNSIALDNAGNIWVASSGKTIYNADWSVDTENSTAPSISKISSDLTVDFTIDSEDITYNAGNIQLSEDGSELLFSYADGIYSLSTVATATSFFELFLETSLYGFSVNPNNGNIIVCQAPDFSSAGNMIRYTSAGVLIDEHVAGIGPNGAGF